MDTSMNKHDTLEQLIYNEGIRIQAIDIHRDVDVMLIILNTGSVLKEKLSAYPLLQNASNDALLNYKLTGKGTGVHWPDVDEDLSLKGFLRDAVKSQVLGNKVA